MVKHTQTIRWLLSVFDHFVGLALKGLRTGLSYTVFRIVTENQYSFYYFDSTPLGFKFHNNETEVAY